MGQVRTKRVYDDPDPSDGYRILVDRLWPRGRSRSAAHLDEWMKDVAPSPELRTWFGHRPERFAEFADRYRAELDGSAALEELRSRCASHPVLTLLSAAKDPVHNHVRVLLPLLGSSGSPEQRDERYED